MVNEGISSSFFNCKIIVTIGMADSLGYVVNFGISDKFYIMYASGIQTITTVNDDKFLWLSTT